MARTALNILQSLIAKLPNGFAMGFRGGILDALLGGAAREIEIVEQAAEAVMLEIDPRTANYFLPDFERVLGSDPCGRDLDPLSVEQRQRLAHQRWTATGGQAIPYMVSIAGKLGVSVTVEEFWPSKAGRLRAGQRLRPEGSQFVWRVNIPGLITVVNFRAGVSRAGNRLGSFTLSSIECELRRIKPAHTEIVFSYSEA